MCRNITSFVSDALKAMHGNIYKYDSSLHIRWCIGCLLAFENHLMNFKLLTYCNYCNVGNLNHQQRVHNNKLFNKQFYTRFLREQE